MKDLLTYYPIIKNWTPAVQAVWQLATDLTPLISWMDNAWSPAWQLDQEYLIRSIRLSEPNTQS